MSKDSAALKNLAYIRKTMETAGTYTNIPAGAYISAGVISLLGCFLTLRWIGPEKLSQIRSIQSYDILILATTWSLVLILAVLFAILFSINNARKQNLAAWNSLAARLFFSQIPMVYVAGAITVAFTLKHLYDLIPAVWLLCYGVIAFSFSYFTGREHRIQSAIFIALGTLALFSTPPQALGLLAIGFGGLHLLFGIVYLVKN